MARQYTLTQLRYFCAVARSGSMTAAARELAVAQSTLSSAVNELEITLGVSLFERTPRRSLALSSAGKRLLAEALMVLERVDQLPMIAKGGPIDLCGELVVGIFAPLASFRAAQLLTAYSHAYPQVDLRYIEGDLEEVRRTLSGGRCDVALMYDVGVGESFPSSVVERIPPHVVVAANHPLATQKEPVHLREIVDEPFVLLDLPHSRDYYLRLFDIAGLSPRIQFRLPGYEAVRSFVACGHGYSLLNLRLPHHSTHAGLPLTRIELADRLPSVSVVVVYPPRGRPSQKAIAFEQVCRRVLGSEDHGR